MATVRYITTDVGEAVGFYADRLGFRVDVHPGPGFAALSRGDVRLLLNAPGAGGAGQGDPAPGGWSRFQLEVADLDGFVADLRDAGCRFRTEIVTGNGGRQALVEDPSGNVVELFEPA